MTIPIPSDLDAGNRAFDEEDYVKAFGLLLPYAEMGDAVAQCRVAHMYQVGVGTVVDGQKAVEWYLKAARQEIRGEKSVSALAYHNLATVYSTGAPGITISSELAREYWRKSIDLGSNLIPRSWIEGK